MIRSETPTCEGSKFLVLVALLAGGWYFYVPPQATVTASPATATSLDIIDLRCGPAGT